MDLSRALGQLADIHQQIAKGEIYRGYRSVPVAASGLIGVVAGAIITASLVHLSATLVPLLPGLWAICFGLGIFASRPYLPRASGWVALFYYAAGVPLLWMAHGTEPLHAWW